MFYKEFTSVHAIPLLRSPGITYRFAYLNRAMQILIAFFVPFAGPYKVRYVSLNTNRSTKVCLPFIKNDGAISDFNITKIRSPVYFACVY